MKVGEAELWSGGLQIRTGDGYRGEWRWEELRTHPGQARDRMVKLANTRITVLGIMRNPVAGRPTNRRENLDADQLAKLAERAQILGLSSEKRE